MTDPYFSQSGPPPLPQRPAGVAPPRACWHCHSWLAPEQAACPYCGAAQVAAAPAAVPNGYFVPTAMPYSPVTTPMTAPTASSSHSAKHVDDVSQIVKLIGYFGAMLLTAIVLAAVVRVKFKDVEELSRDQQLWMLYATLVVEAIDTFIVVCAWSQLSRPGVRRESSTASAIIAWVAAAPGLALLLACNFGYHALLRKFLPTVEEVELMMPGREWLYLLAFCVQPAIVEEFFFRGLVLDGFRSEMSTLGAVLVSSVMFGVCHVYAPISVPYLIAAGVVFAAARIWSGGLLLPMLLHFLHNLLVGYFQR